MDSVTPMEEEKNYVLVSSRGLNYLQWADRLLQTSNFAALLLGGKLSGLLQLLIYFSLPGNY